MSASLAFAENELQLIALGFMALVYILRIRWILRYKAGWDRQAPTGNPGSTPAKGAIYSLFNIAMPWAMESTRQKFFFYVQFVIFHLGVVAAIAMSFVIPYAPHLMEPPWVVYSFQGILGAACVIGCYRLYRRFTHPVMRQISTPDDIFSLLLLTVFFFSAALAAPNRPDQGEGALLFYFLMTAFFLFYVPFSKISHYLYYPFTRFYFGRTMGHRGVYPMKHSPQPKPTKN
jgi:nitrate reductase gamma subunit